MILFLQAADLRKTCQENTSPCKGWRQETAANRPPLCRVAFGNAPTCDQKSVSRLAPWKGWISIPFDCDTRPSFPHPVGQNTLFKVNPISSRASIRDQATRTPTLASPKIRGRRLPILFLQAADLRKTCQENTSPCKGWRQETAANRPPLCRVAFGNAPTCDQKSV